MSSAFEVYLSPPVAVFWCFVVGSPKVDITEYFYLLSSVPAWRRHGITICMKFSPTFGEYEI
jgi:hypothetical protein